MASWRTRQLKSSQLSSRLYTSSDEQSSFSDRVVISTLGENTISAGCMTPASSLSVGVVSSAASWPLSEPGVDDAEMGTAAISALPVVVS